LNITYNYLKNEDGLQVIYGCQQVGVAYVVNENKRSHGPAVTQPVGPAPYELGGP